MGTIKKELRSDNPVLDQPSHGRLLLFRLGDLQLGVELTKVNEVARATGMSIPFPGEGALLGLIELRGESTPVIDLGRLLNIPHADQDRRLISMTQAQQTVCLLIDKIDGLDHFAPDLVEDASGIGIGPHADWLHGVTRSASGDLIGLLDMDRVVAELAECDLAAETACA